MTPLVTTPAFRAAYSRTSTFEGGWSNDPYDRGGKTKYGVTEKTWAAYHAPRKPPYGIEDITRDDAQAVFWNVYWCGAKLHRLEAAGCPQILLCDAFDAVVHHGVHGGSVLLQEAYNLVCGKRVSLNVDGVIGSKTCTSIAAFCLSNDHAAGLLGAFRYLRGKKFFDACVNDLSQAKFLCGWMRRIV